MNKKFTVLVLMLASLVIFLPSSSQAATEGNTGLLKTVTEFNASSAQVRVQIGPNRRRVNRRYNRRIVRRAIRRNNRPRYIRQVFYRNGRRYVRTVRVY